MYLFRPTLLNFLLILYDLRLLLYLLIASIKSSVGILCGSLIPLRYAVKIKFFLVYRVYLLGIFIPCERK